MSVVDVHVHVMYCELASQRLCSVLAEAGVSV